jgi:hypothetical protein
MILKYRRKSAAFILSGTTCKYGGKHSLLSGLWHHSTNRLHYGMLCALPSEYHYITLTDRVQNTYMYTLENHYSLQCYGRTRAYDTTDGSVTTEPRAVDAITVPLVPLPKPVAWPTRESLVHWERDQDLD